MHQRGAEVAATFNEAEVGFIGRPLGVPTPNETSTINGADPGATSDAAEVVFIGRPLGVPTPNETKTLALVDVF